MKVCFQMPFRKGCRHHTSLDAWHQFQTVYTTLAFSSISSSVSEAYSWASSSLSSGSSSWLEVSLPSDCFLFAETREKNPWIWSFESYFILLNIRVSSVLRALSISLATCAGSSFLPVPLWFQFELEAWLSFRIQWNPLEALKPIDS